MTAPLRTPDASANARLLEFVLPGFVHAFGNHLFTIQGNAQVLAMGTGRGEFERERRAILGATKDATEALDLLRFLGGGDSGGAEEMPAGSLLHLICSLCKVPLREAGVRLVEQHSSQQTPVPVEAAPFCRALVETLACLRDAVPSGFDGDLEVDLQRQSHSEICVALQVAQKPSLLPFPLDLAQAHERAAPLVLAMGAELSAPDPKGQLLLCYRLLASSE